MGKSQKMLKVRHKVSGIERDMTEASYKNLKRHYDVLGIIGEDGSVNPNTPQLSASKENQGAPVVGIGKVVPSKQPDAPILDKVVDEDQSQDQEEESQDEASDVATDQEQTKDEGTDEAPVLSEDAIPGAEVKTRPVVDVSNITQTTTDNPAASGKSRTASDTRKGSKKRN